MILGCILKLIRIILGEIIFLNMIFPPFKIAKRSQEKIVKQLNYLKV